MEREGSGGLKRGGGRLTGRRQRGSSEDVASPESPDSSNHQYSAQLTAQDVRFVLQAECTRQGILEKKVHNKHWRKRFVRIQCDHLVEYEVADMKSLTPDTAPVDIVAIQNRTVLCNVSKFKFILKHHDHGHKAQDAYKADSEENMQGWIKDICTLQDQNASTSGPTLRYYRGSARDKMKRAATGFLHKITHTDKFDDTQELATMRKSVTDAMEHMWLSLLHVRDLLEHGGRSQYALVDLVSHLHHFIDFLSETLVLLEGRESADETTRACQQHITALCHTCTDIARFCDTVQPALVHDDQLTALLTDRLGDFQRYANALLDSSAQALADIDAAVPPRARAASSSHSRLSFTGDDEQHPHHAHSSLRRGSTKRDASTGGATSPAPGTGDAEAGESGINPDQMKRFTMMGYDATRVARALSNHSEDMLAVFRELAEADKDGRTHSSSSTDRRSVGRRMAHLGSHSTSDVQPRHHHHHHHHQHLHHSHSQQPPHTSTSNSHHHHHLHHSASQPSAHDTRKRTNTFSLSSHFPLFRRRSFDGAEPCASARSSSPNIHSNAGSNAASPSQSPQHEEPAGRRQQAEDGNKPQRRQDGGGSSSSSSSIHRGGSTGATRPRSRHVSATEDRRCAHRVSEDITSRQQQQQHVSGTGYGEKSGGDDSDDDDADSDKEDLVEVLRGLRHEDDGSGSGSDTGPGGSPPRTPRRSSRFRGAQLVDGNFVMPPLSEHGEAVETGGDGGGGDDDDGSGAAGEGRSAHGALLRGKRHSLRVTNAFGPAAVPAVGRLSTASHGLLTAAMPRKRRASLSGPRRFASAFSPSSSPSSSARNSHSAGNESAERGPRNNRASRSPLSTRWHDNRDIHASAGSGGSGGSGQGHDRARAGGGERTGDARERMHTNNDGHNSNNSGGGARRPRDDAGAVSDDHGGEEEVSDGGEEEEEARARREWTHLFEFPEHRIAAAHLDPIHLFSEPPSRSANNPFMVTREEHERIQASALALFQDDDDDDDDGNTTANTTAMLNSSLLSSASAAPPLGDLPRSNSTASTHSLSAAAELREEERNSFAHSFSSTNPFKHLKDATRPRSASCVPQGHPLHKSSSTHSLSALAASPRLRSSNPFLMDVARERGAGDGSGSGSGEADATSSGGNGRSGSTGGQAAPRSGSLGRRHGSCSGVEQATSCADGVEMRRGATSSSSSHPSQPRPASQPSEPAPPRPPKPAHLQADSSGHSAPSPLSSSRSSSQAAPPPLPARRPRPAPVPIGGGVVDMFQASSSGTDLKPSPIAVDALRSRTQGANGNTVTATVTASPAGAVGGLRDRPPRLRISGADDADSSTDHIRAASPPATGRGAGGGGWEAGTRAGDAGAIPRSSTLKGAGGGDLRPRSPLAKPNNPFSQMLKAKEEGERAEPPSPVRPDTDAGVQEAMQAFIEEGDEIDAETGLVIRKLESSDAAQPAGTGGSGAHGEDGKGKQDGAKVGGPPASAAAPPGVRAQGDASGETQASASSAPAPSVGADDGASATSSSTATPAATPSSRSLATSTADANAASTPGGGAAAAATAAAAAAATPTTYYCRVRAGTLTQALEYLISDRMRDPNLLGALRTCFPVFTTARDLCQRLLLHHRKLLAARSEAGAKGENEVVWRHCRLATAMSECLEALVPGLSVSELTSLQAVVYDLLQLEHVDVAGAFLEDLWAAIDLRLEEEQYEEEKELAATSQPRAKVASPTAPAGQRTTALLAHSSGDLARELCVMANKLFSRISTRELLAWRKKQTAEQSPSVMRMIQHFNRVSMWAATCVVCTPKLKQRVKVVNKLIHIMKHLKKQQNFDTLLAILSGLNNAAVYRLKHTFASLNAKSQGTLSRLKELMSHDKSFLKFRYYCRQLKPPVIPYLGMYLSDIVFVHVGNPDFVELGPAVQRNNTSEKIINFAKMHQLYNICAAIEEYQSHPYKFRTKDEVRQCFDDFKHKTDDELYSLSLQIEPRGASIEQIA